MSEDASQQATTTTADTATAATQQATPVTTTTPNVAGVMTTTNYAPTTAATATTASFSTPDMAAVENGVLQMAQAARAAAAAEQSEHDRNLIVNYIPPSVNELSLQALFAPYGEIERCKLMMDLQTGTGFFCVSCFSASVVFGLQNHIMHSRW